MDIYDIGLSCGSAFGGYPDLSDGCMRIARECFYEGLFTSIFELFTAGQ